MIVQQLLLAPRSSGEEHEGRGKKTRDAWVPEEMAKNIQRIRSKRDNVGNIT
jgi:hypothetical protein